MIGNINNSIMRVLLALTICGTVLCQSVRADTPPFWARQALPIPNRYGAGEYHFKSPDKKSTVNISGYTVTVLKGNSKLRGLDKEGVIEPAELLWAPNSESFFINEDDGGATGTWLVALYVIIDEGVRRHDVTKLVTARMQSLYPCENKEQPNIAGLKWSKDSTVLYIVAQVPPHSSCKEMGRYVGFVVSVATGRITSEITDKTTLVREWGEFMSTNLRDSMNSTSSH